MAQAFGRQTKKNEYSVLYEDILTRRYGGTNVEI